VGKKSKIILYLFFRESIGLTSGAMSTLVNDILFLPHHHNIWAQDVRNRVN
jgi:hypothetical protein